ncbi:hypothetical protein LCGC14_0868640 [marine sediment metagenome]|uniref:Alanyl-transfer RNA synthetases family profile domain-containing protein n=1 Tax=marine sediment metagenome TaxID=412755 RepID=A0A0F9PA48_9ZZZZ
MTRKLYWETPYDKQFTAKVVSIKTEGIILDQTLFYPYGGNQLSDHGIIRIKDVDFSIKNVTKEDNEIIHHITPNFQNKVKVGEEVVGQIDWKRRYGLMKSHTSQHIFSAVIKNKYDINTIRATLNFEDVSLSISRVLSYEQLKSVLQEINEIFCFNNLKINGRILAHKEIEPLRDLIRGNIPNKSQIRIVEIEDLDMVCCGGTHVKNSTEIGSLFIYDFKKGKEIKYCIGANCLNMLTNINVDLLDISNSLNVSISNIRVKNNKNNVLISNLQDKNKILALKTLKLIAKNPIDTINGVLIFILEYDMDHKIISKNMHLFPLETVLVIKMTPKKFRIISKIQAVNANNIMQVFIKKFGGKGGGNSSSAQGTFNIDPEDIISDLKEILSKN